jgi:hypothetical protein
MNDGKPAAEFFGPKGFAAVDALRADAANQRSSRRRSHPIQNKGHRQLLLLTWELEIGASEGIRTLDPNLGNVRLILEFEAERSRSGGVKGGRLKVLVTYMLPLKFSIRSRLIAIR